MQKLKSGFLFRVCLTLLALGVMSASPLLAQTTKNASSASSGTKVDLNTASEKDLDGLPGVGPATAKKIIAGRPYASVDDLSKAGISSSTLKKITPLVMVSGAAPASANATSPATPPPASKPSSAAASQPAPSASQGQPGPGMVWVNLSSGVYHYSGSQYYGKTKSGKYMPEADAIKAGYRAAKNEKKPQ
jgi:Helix-hairpin-helix motif